jgi:four helix bundle protein
MRVALTATGLGSGPRLKAQGPSGIGPGLLGVLQKLRGLLMAKYASFRELVVWQKGMDLAEKVHRATRSFASEDLFTLGTQLRRAANSVPANVGEGFSRRSRGAYRAHISIALGSNAEVQTPLELARRLSLIEQALTRELQSLAEEIGRLLFGLWRSLFVGAVCYSLGLLALLSGLPWAVVHILSLQT